MIPLRVTVELHGTVIEDRLLKVQEDVRLGDSRWADVPFPGADLTVTRVGMGLEVRGRTLRQGVPLSLTLGAVVVTMEATAVGQPSPWGWAAPAVDLRVLVATVGVALTGSFIESVDRFVQNDPIASEQIAEWLEPGWADDASRTARAHVAPPDELPDGLSVEPEFELPEAPPPAAQYIDLLSDR